MTTFFETGHAKNISNFEDLVSFCIAYGTVYNPANSNITITALQVKHSAALADLQAVKSAKTALDNATNLREITFAPCRVLATRVINALSAVSPSKLTIEDAKTINRKIQGKRSKSIKKVLPSDSPTPLEETIEAPDNTISASQQSYDSLTDHFAKLIETLSAEPLYIPNETDLNVAGLTTLLSNMKAANSGVINETTTYSNARIDRDKTLYDAGTGLVNTALDVKKYIKSIFGSASPEYKQVGKIKFRPYII